MNQRTKWFMFAGIIIIVLSISLSIVFTRGTMYDFHFETGLEGWIGDADNHVGEGDSIIIDWNVTRTSEQVYEGEYSVALEIDGTQDDGGVWIEKLFELKKKKKISISISFQFYSDNIGMNIRAWIFAAVNKTNPEIEEDFDFEKTTLAADSNLGDWTKFKITFHLEDVEQFWIAIGIRVAWETFLKFFVDDITVKIY